MIPPALIIAGVVAVVIGGQAIAIHHYRSEALVWEQKYTGFVAETKAVGEAAAEKAKRQEAEQKLAVNQIEVEHAKNVSAINSSYSSELARLRSAQAGSRPGSGAVPKPTIIAGVCRDDADNARLSLALENARLNTRSALTEYRIGIVSLLSEADNQRLTVREAIGILLSERGVAAR